MTSKYFYPNGLQGRYPVWLPVWGDVSCVWELPAGTLVFCFHLHQILKYLEISWCQVTPLTRKNLKGPQPYNPVLIIFIKWVLIHTHLLNEYLLNLFQMIIKWVFICQEAASWHVWHGPTSVLWPGAWTWYYSIANNYWLPKTLQWIKDNIYADTEF